MRMAGWGLPPRPWPCSRTGAGGEQPAGAHSTMSHAAHYSGPVGRVATTTFDPTAFARSWNFSTVAPDRRGRHYRESSRPDGSLLREYDIVATDREIEIAPGLFFPAWTYNGQVPGPTIRATEGDRVRVNFLNQGSHPHTIHFHGWHPPEMDGSLPEHQVMPGARFVYEFDAEPSGLHLYHCHAVPLKRHIHKGLYGVVHHRPEDTARACRRAGDGDERLRHELRCRQRGVRGQHRRTPFHARADSRDRGCARPHLPRQRHRVRPDQQPASARDVLRCLPHGHGVARSRSGPTR